MIVNILLLLLALVLIIVFSNLFVNSISSLAAHFKVSKMVIALTIASFCTCAPELVISFSSINNNQDVTLANVIGSCIVNILLIVGIASFIKPINTKNQTIKKELPILVVSSLVFLLLTLDSVLSRYDAIVLIMLFVVFCLYVSKLIKQSKKQKTSDEVVKYSKGKAILLTIISLAFIIFAGELIVNQTIGIADRLNISTKIITMFIVVIGTSLPEFMITITSAKKGEFDMAIGNIIGTNIFNIGIVLGLPTAIFGSITSTAFSIVDTVMVVLAALVFYYFAKSDKVISRKEGIIMLLVFSSYYIYLLIGGNI